MITMDNGKTWNQFRLHLPTQRINGESDNTHPLPFCAWWRHQMETFSALLAICAGNSPVPGEFPTQRPVTRSFDIYFDLRPNKRLSNGEACDLRRNCAHYDVIVMCFPWRRRRACACACACACVWYIQPSHTDNHGKVFLWKHIC